MKVRNYHKTLLVRFLTYFFILFGITIIILGFGPIIQAELNYRVDQALGIKHILPSTIITSQGQEELPQSTPQPEQGALAGFGNLPNVTDQVIKPVSTDYGIVIEKIDANAQVVDNVDPADEKQYVQALSKGVAAAKGSTKPGQPGNLYIFSHSTDGPWNVARYNAIFYLLRELKVGDTISIFYQGRRYNYIVYDKIIAKANDVSFLTNRYDKPVLTLQTCDPPGTQLNRLIIRAQLVGS